MTYLDALSASPIACAVADWWAAIGEEDFTGSTRMRVVTDLKAREALDALEAATRESPLRKVRP